MVTNPLAGKPLRYLIGADGPFTGALDETIIGVPYGDPRAKQGISIGYCNLFDEENTGKFGPYLKDTDTSREYNEGVIDPNGVGWLKNLNQQFKRRRAQGFWYVELDNPDAYDIACVLFAIDHAASYGLKVVAKNPMLFELEYDRRAYLRHPNIHGAIVEREAGVPEKMATLRADAGKPDLPTWFVGFGSAGRFWGKTMAADITARGLKNMGVTYSEHGEYTDSIDILRPRT